MTLFSRLTPLMAIVAGCAYAAENDAALRGATGTKDLMEPEEDTGHFDLFEHARRLLEVEGHDDPDHTRELGLDDPVVGFDYMPAINQAFGSGDDDVDGDGMMDRAEPPMCRKTAKRPDHTPAHIWTNLKEHKGFPRSFQGCAVNDICPCEWGGVMGSGWQGRWEYKRCIKEVCDAFVHESFIEETERDEIMGAAEASSCGSSDS